MTPWTVAYQAGDIRDTGLIPSFNKTDEDTCSQDVYILELINNKCPDMLEGNKYSGKSKSTSG